MATSSSSLHRLMTTRDCSDSDRTVFMKSIDDVPTVKRLRSLLLIKTSMPDERIKNKEVPQHLLDRLRRLVSSLAHLASPSSTPASG
jgi:hypothetical protein